MPDKKPLRLWWANAKKRLPVHWQSPASQFYVIFSVFLAVSSHTLGSLSPNPDVSLQATLLSVFIGFLLVLYTLGMPLRGMVYIGLSYGFFHLLREAAWTGGMFSNTLKWVVILPLIPLFLLELWDGLFWLVMSVLCLCGMALAQWWDWVPAVFVAAPQLLRMNAWSNVAISLFLISLPLIYQRLYLRTRHVSEKRQTNLLKTRARLLRAQTLKNNFIALLSHELRTPMNAIMGFSDLLREEVKDLPRALELADLVKQSSHHLLTVINDVLDFSLLQRGELKVQAEPFALLDTVNAAFKLFVQRVQSMKIEYRLHTDDNLPAWVVSDPHRLMQVLVNLLGNAIKFTHQGQVSLRVERVGDQLRFTVQDTGIGIEQSKLSHIFEPFVQASPNTAKMYGGNGLGLAISRQLVHLLGGDMGVESQLGHGCRFWVNLPMVIAASPAPLAVRDERMGRLQQFAVRILVVDDSAVNRLLACQVVKTHWPNALLVQAADGQVALDILAQSSFDMVLMDMLMPVMDGIEATRRLRSEWPSPQSQVPVLGLTANVHNADHDRCLAVGMSGLVLKPFDRHALCSLIEEQLLRSAAFLQRFHRTED